MTRILLIEDSPTQGHRFRYQLEDAGYEVELCADAETGLIAFERGRFDLVISDIVLPGMSGFELCRRIKARPEAERMPVVLMTQLEDPRDILRALEAGADNYVSKSEAEAILVPHIEALLSQRAAREAAAERDGLVVRFMDDDYAVPANPERALDLLVTTVEDTVRARRQLEITNRQLERQNEALRRAEMLKKELSALVVHDLKSPTSGLLMLAQMQLRKSTVEDSDRARWRMVFSTAEMLQRMILNLLDISRSEDGALDPVTEGVELQGLVDEVCEVLRFQLDERRIALDVRVAAEAEHLFADRELLRRVLLNLLDNACRHAPAGGRIEVSAERRRTGVVQVCVSNSGSHIPAEHRERVFEKYVRLDRALGESLEPGRGLGLPFCRTAVEAHGGRIWVEDRPGGTAFCFELPVEARAEPLEPPPA